MAESNITTHSNSPLPTPHQINIPYRIKLTLQQELSDSLDSQSSKVCPRTQSLLSHLLLPGLLRSERLQADIRTLTGTPDHRIEEQLKTVSENGRLAEFIAHTKQSVQTNPHVLLAYAWVLYMALFSGGRYLRAALKTAGGSEDFWDRDASPVRPYEATRAPKPTESPSKGLSEEEIRPSARRQTRSESSQTMKKDGLQFFDFVGDEDGEDIKREFKRRIAETEVQLTDSEKADIIKEAQAIFSFYGHDDHRTRRHMWKYGRRFRGGKIHTVHQTPPEP
ncbi:hypothetical protein DID88_007138 [Monilinia fructigena]|uniref:Heme oxygenase-like protein n=1 Tax=Monilinia fructigena TaxID=38457 RepID=A0A395J7E3_9HELO|nr:hypothetical protein DID88_007138 [Monilinia fructigena]